MSGFVLAVAMLLADELAGLPPVGVAMDPPKTPEELEKCKIILTCCHKIAIAAVLDFDKRAGISPRRDT